MASSAIDHVYLSSELFQDTQTSKLENSASDHLPIVAAIKIPKREKLKARTITKRSLKDFTKTKWTSCLTIQRWEDIGETNNLDEMTNKLTRHVTTALDVCAPLKTIKIRQHHKFGISESTKALIKERDLSRKMIHKVSHQEKAVQQNKYKKLRNRVNSQLKKDNLNFNSDRIKKAKDENEVWKIVKDVTSPRTNQNITLIENGVEITKEEEVAELFNEFFVEKISKLKQNIDNKYKEDPLQRLKAKMESKNLKFKLKPVTEKKVLKIIKSMKSKKSSGLDELTQAQMILGADILAIPLTRIINTSITEAKFPDMWKEGVVTPVLKKGSPKDKMNYRPVTCLSVLSKVLEKVVCLQITKYMESHNLLPSNQHGFRAGRSTMSALTAIQQEWANNTTQGLISGILLWDLSAAFDTLDTSTLCSKLAIYGFDMLSCNWFRSFLTGRTQRVKIGRSLSSSKRLESGVPQGGILSPIIFVVYGADMEQWLNHSSALTYADDTSSTVTGMTMNEVKFKLEEDAEMVLKFMASNGLVANPSKTTLMILNSKERTPLEIKVGDSTVNQVPTAKLLGVKIDESQKWKSQISGKGGVISALNQRLFLINRLKNQVNTVQLKKITDSIWSSKMRYGLQLYGEVRTQEEAKMNMELGKLQKAQNNLLRSLENVKVSDKVSIKSMLENQNMLSVNQTHAQIKILEIWRSINIANNPNKVKTINHSNSDRTTRGMTSGLLQENNTPNTCLGDATRLWNKAPDTVRTPQTLNGAKIASKIYCKTLPV